jgi:hypothetical protein
MKEHDQHTEDLPEAAPGSGPLPRRLRSRQAGPREQQGLRPAGPELDASVDREVTVSGEFVDIAGERFYTIRKVDGMAPFFISVISSSDHWLFVSSTGGLTAGRVSPESALFPYVTVDKVHECTPHTGGRTVLRVREGDGWRIWEPFNREQRDRYALNLNLYKNVLGNKLCFEEVNQDLQLTYRYTWCTSDRYGFARQCELQNLSNRDVTIELLDGLQNILPAGTPSFTQANSSNLVDAYKWTELCEETGLAIYALYSGISDRAEPCESLRANTVFSLGLENTTVLISSRQLDDFRAGRPVAQETHKRGIRGAYIVAAELQIPGGAARQWVCVANVQQTQSQVVELKRQLDDPERVMAELGRSIQQGSEELARIVASADGFQATAEESVTAHHYANVLFNILRGGVFDDQYKLLAEDFKRAVAHFNRDVHERHREWLEGLPHPLDMNTLLSSVKERGDPQLERLCYEYLPITFGRRHGDPSRPWNMFAIRLKDECGDRLISYEGNWRDIFQNWEALVFSFPEFTENVIAKFVNASTVDGYNPYRITQNGIDWEIEEPDNPWSYIGYWGDHQIIYLLKLLELSRQFHPARIGRLLRRPIFSYANVPYRIRSFDALLENPKHTVDYDHGLAERIAGRVASNGADGRLVLDPAGDVYLVNLVEKLLVPLLCKLGNLVVDGGIWLNTQRPEWNDANNALVGQGLSMVTLYYMRRYVRFLQELLEDETDSIELSAEVSQWLSDTIAALENLRPQLGATPVSAQARFASLNELGRAAGRYRQSVYSDHPFSAKAVRPVEHIKAMLQLALAAIDHSIRMNRREDGLYHAYNLLNLRQDEVTIDGLYTMLEGQVAALSSGAIPPAEAISLLEALYDSDVYRGDQHSFMLYPDRKLPGFLEKNRIPADRIEDIPLLGRMLETGDEVIISRDANGEYRFNADFKNISDLNARLEVLSEAYGSEIEAARESLQEMYESVFNHRAFTGRSGGMFGFEGLGCIYWHMVSKLLLAVQENFFAALDQHVDESTVKRLGSLYYRVRHGLGFNKTPAEYGAFPTDPYSHTPKHGGAQQPGMTGQVKEEVLSRFGEFGVRVRDGQVRFDPRLLRKDEFLADRRQLRFLNVDGEWESLSVSEHALAFTWCQVPVIYRLSDDTAPILTVMWDDGRTQVLPNPSLSPDLSSEIFRRSGRLRKMTLSVPAGMVFGQ